MRLKIALLQLPPGNSLEDQLEKGKAACVKAKEIGADIALFPEMWSNGYRLAEDEALLHAQSIAAESAFVRSFGILAGECSALTGNFPKARASCCWLARK